LFVEVSGQVSIVRGVVSLTTGLSYVSI
jgi:hypothetical protein